jgi:predicted transposase YbfD/YdcC
MDTQEYTGLIEALDAVPDPRNRRGCRYPWLHLLVLISLALASGERHGRGIGQWVRERASALRAFGRMNGDLPSEATLRRALRAIDVVALEARLAQVRVADPARPGVLTGQALDGKAVRGAGTHGRTVHLVGLASHNGIIQRQVAVADKANEITAAPALLADRDLQGVVITTDALLTQRRLAQQIRVQGGHYLMVVKGNQPELVRAIIDQFAAPHWLPHEQAVEYARHRTIEKGHGRLETRTLETATTLRGWLRWPDAEQVCKRTCRRVILTTGEIQEEVSYAVTSLAPDLAGPAMLERLWRGHWAIENKVHHVRDVTLGEDAGQAYRGSTPHALAALRNVLLNLMRAAGWSQIADAIRHYGAAVAHALDLIGLPAAPL